MAFDNHLLAFVLLALLVALVVSFLMTPVVKTFAYKVGAIDVPKDDRRMHKVPIPRLGGLAIFIGFMVSILLFVPITREMRSILLGAVVIVILGVIDDSMALPAMLKFVVQILAALVGACIGFMPYNLNPAKMFMGDTGATFLGYILATMSIQGLFKYYAVISFVVPFLILGLPIFDTAFAFIRRLAHGQSPMHADRGHIHHRLIDMGLSQKQAVATLYVISAILGLSAVVLTTSGEEKAMLLFAALCIAAVVAARLAFPREVRGELHEGMEELREHGHRPPEKTADQAGEAAPKDKEETD